MLECPPTSLLESSLVSPSPLHMFHARLDAVAAVRARTLRAPGRRARLIADAAPAAHSDGLDALLS